jgi:hypothetical protein
MYLCHYFNCNSRSGWGLQEANELQKSRQKYKRASKGLNSAGRLRLLEKMHDALGGWMDLEFAGDMAVRNDDLGCFLYAHDNDVFPFDSGMEAAVEHGALSILRYGLEHTDEFWWDGWILRMAAWQGSAQAVDLVLRTGCDRVRATLCIAAAYGHLDCVRFLHARGFPLWDDVRPSGDVWYGPGFQRNDVYVYTYGTTLHVPPTSRQGHFLWGVLSYGAMHGAPVPGWFSAERRERAREVLLCFHGAARVSRGGGEDIAGRARRREGRRHRDRGRRTRLWRVMARVPVDVVYLILVAAELEVKETFKQRTAQGPVEDST